MFKSLLQPVTIDDMTTLLILSALPREIQPIQETFPGDVIHEGGLDIMHYHKGELHVLSTHGGMGTTNIAAAAQTLITVAHYVAKADTVSMLFTGIAGNLNSQLSFGDVVLAHHLVYEETDRAIIAEDPPYLEIFDADSQLLALAQKVVFDERMTEVPNNAHIEDASTKMYTSEGIRQVSHLDQNFTDELSSHRFTIGTVATSNLFSTEPSILKDIIENDCADAEEMEGAAVSHVCHKNNIASLVIRSMSNDCGESYTQLDSREDDLNTAARIAAKITIAIAKQLFS